VACETRSAESGLSDKGAGNWEFTKQRHHMAYFLVHSLANSLYFSLSVL